MRQRLTLLLLTLFLAAGFGVAIPDAARAGDDDDRGSRSGNNSAVAENTRDGSSLFRFAFDISRVAGDVVDNHNEAVAYSSCESCRTTAIAIQIVLVAGKPSTVTPTNVAVAVNYECSLCQTFATAYQFVVGTGEGPVTFTKQGWREIQRIKRDINALRRQDLTPAELDARVKAIVDRLRVVLDTQLVPARGRDDDDDDDDGDDDGDDDEREDEDSEERRDLAPEERPTTSTTREGESTDTITTPAPPATTTEEAETGTTPTETAPVETTRTETTPTETTPTDTTETTPAETATTETGTTTGG